MSQVNNNNCINNKYLSFAGEKSFENRFFSFAFGLIRDRMGQSHQEEYRFSVLKSGVNRLLTIDVYPESGVAIQSLSTANEKELEGLPSIQVESDVDPLSFIQDVMGKDEAERVQLIRQHQLGEVLSNLVKNGRQDREIVALSEKVIETLVAHYFFSSMEWKNGERSLAKSQLKDSHLYNQIERTIETLPKTSKGSTAITFARDIYSRELKVAPSKRLWASQEVSTLLWEEAKRDWEKALSSEQLVFPRLSAERVTFSIFAKALSIYADCCRYHHKKHLVSQFLDVNFVRGRFNWKLHRLFSTRTAEARIELFHDLKAYFPHALEYEQWCALYRLLDRPVISDADINAAIASCKSTQDQVMAMAVSNMTCGEIRVALDYCRDPHKPSHTLGAQVQFLTVLENNDGLRDIQEIPTCERCVQSWPALEAVYWALKESGLDLTAIEKLDRSFLAL